MFYHSCRFCLTPVFWGPAYPAVDPPFPHAWLATPSGAVPVGGEETLAARRCVSSPMMTKEHQV